MLTQKKTKTVHLTYYAFLKEERGKPEETVETAAATALALYDDLRQRYGFGLPVDSLKVSINDEFSSWQTELVTGDRVVFIPPVAGGQ